MKRGLLNPRPELHFKQDAMARNMGKLKSRGAKEAQAHTLCQSLVAMLRAKGRGNDHRPKRSISHKNPVGFLWVCETNPRPVAR